MEKCASHSTMQHSGGGCRATHANLEAGEMCISPSTGGMEISFCDSNTHGLRKRDRQAHGRALPSR